MDESVVVRLKLIASKANQLALDLERGRLWEGDLSKGINEISKQLQIAKREYGGSNTRW